MPTQFDTFVNNAYATLASPYTAGSGSLALATGEGARFGSTFPICVTVITAATYRTTAEALAIYTVTGRSTDTLTGVSVAESTTDRTFSTGDIVEMRFTAGEANLFSSTINTLQSASYGTVSSVAASVPSWLSVSGSPITSSGTLALTAAAGQTANQVLATPNGSSGALSVRALAAADIPAITTSQISNLSSWAGSTSITTLGTIATGTVPQANVSGLNSALALLAPLASPTFTGTVTLPAGTVTLAQQANLAASSLIGNATASPAAPSAVTLGAGLTFSGTTIVGHSGTVTSVSWTGDGTIFTASADTPVTTSGTLAPASLISQSANTVLAGPATGSAAAPTFRTLVAADLAAANLLIVSDGTISSGTWTANLASGGFHTATLGAATTLAFSNVSVGQQFMIRVTQGSTPYALTFPSGITWFTPTFTAPNMPQTAAGVMTCLFTCTGSGTYDGFYCGSSSL